MLGPGRLNLRPGLSYLLDDPRMKVSIPSFAFVSRSSAFPCTALSSIKNERPQDASVRDGIAKRELKFGRLEAVSRKIAIDFETDAHFDKCRSCP
jgi:hypothetical protein